MPWRGWNPPPTTDPFGFGYNPARPPITPRYELPPAPAPTPIQLPRSVPGRDVGIRAVAGPIGLGMSQLRAIRLAPTVAVPLRRGAGDPRILPTELPNTTTPGTSIIAEEGRPSWLSLIILGGAVLWLAR